MQPNEWRHQQIAKWYRGPERYQQHIAKPHRPPGESGGGFDRQACEDGRQGKRLGQWQSKSDQNKIHVHDCPNNEPFEGAGTPNGKIPRSVIRGRGHRTPVKRSFYPRHCTGNSTSGYYTTGNKDRRSRKITACSIRGHSKGLTKRKFRDLPPPYRTLALQLYRAY